MTQEGELHFADIPRPGVAPTTLTTTQLAALLQSWNGFPQQLTIHHVLIMLVDLGLLGGLTDAQVSQTVQGAGGPAIVSRGKTGS